MTLEQLKELLATYGVNEQERSAAVVVTIDGQDVPIASAEVDNGVWDEQAHEWVDLDRITVRLSTERMV